MVDYYTVIGITLGIFLVAVSLKKLKNQTISQNTFTLWFIIGILIIIGSTIPSVIFILQDILATELTISAIFGMFIVFLIIMVFLLHQKIDTMNERIVNLAARIAVKRFYKSNEEDENEL